MKISVAMCTYNGEQFIVEQIDSILKQTVKVDEIVICDDMSTDKTIQIIEKYKNDFPDLFRIIKNKNNLQSVKNFEKAITLCTGDYIFLADQDDIWKQSKVAEYLYFFKNNPTIKVLTSNGYCIDANGKLSDKYAIWDIPAFMAEKGNDVDYYELICYSTNIATGSSMAIKKEMVSKITPFPIVHKFHHDEWIAIIAAKENMYHHLNEKYFYYRIHDKQQVGGIFFEKTVETKKMLSQVINIDQNNTSFTLYKKKLKNLCSAQHKNLHLYDFDKQKNSFAKENVINIQNMFMNNKQEMLKKYPIRASVLNLVDKLMNKRKMSFINFT